MLYVFYAVVAIAAVFVIVSLQVVKAHEKKVAAREASVEAADPAMPVEQDDDFFYSPLYKAMEFVAHM